MRTPLATALRLEDILLPPAMLLAAPLVFRSDEDHFTAATDVGPFVGLIYLVAAVGGIIVLATRNTGQQPPLLPGDGNTSPRAYAPFPFMAVLGMIGSAGAGGLGLGSPDLLFGIAFVAALAAFFLYEKLPVLPADARRVLIAPCIIISATIFNGLMADLFSEVKPADIGSIVDTAGFGVALMLFIFIPGAVYLMFVFAPRQLAEPEGTWP